MKLDKYWKTRVHTTIVGYVVGLETVGQFNAHSAWGGWLCIITFLLFLGTAVINDKLEEIRK